MQSKVVSPHLIKIWLVFDTFLKIGTSFLLSELILDSRTDPAENSGIGSFPGIIVAPVGKN